MGKESFRQCPSCGAPTTHNKKVCRYCGTLLERVYDGGNAGFFSINEQGEMDRLPKLKDQDLYGKCSIILLSTPGVFGSIYCSHISMIDRTDDDWGIGRW